MLGKGNKAVVSGPPFFRDVAGPLFETFILGLCIVLFKPDQPLWSCKLWRKSYVYQSKAKICAKGAL